MRNAHEIRAIRIALSNIRISTDGNIVELVKTLSDQLMLNIALSRDLLGDAIVEIGETDLTDCPPSNKTIYNVLNKDHLVELRYVLDELEQEIKKIPDVGVSTKNEKAMVHVAYAQHYIHMSCFYCKYLIQQIIKKKDLTDELVTLKSKFRKKKKDKIRIEYIENQLDLTDFE